MTLFFPSTTKNHCFKKQFYMDQLDFKVSIFQERLQSTCQNELPKGTHGLLEREA